MMPSRLVAVVPDDCAAGVDDAFAETIDAAKKYVVSRTLGHLDWNAELVRGDLGEAERDSSCNPR
jgi:hypothetical protein